MKIPSGSARVHCGEGPWFVAEEVDELGRRTAEGFGGALGVVVVLDDLIEGLGEDRGEVVVAGADEQFAAPASGSPEVAGCLQRGVADLDRQEQAEPEKGLLAVLLLRSPLVRLGEQARRPVVEDDGGLDLVPILPPRPRSSGEPLVALGEQASRVKACGVNQWLIHERCDAVRLLKGYLPSTI